MPLQCSCLQNPRDGGAWWAAGYGVTQSQTQLKRVSGSSCFLEWLKLKRLTMCCQKQRETELSYTEEGNQN